MIETTTKCDICKVILSNYIDGKLIGFDNIGFKASIGNSCAFLCSLQCLVILYSQNQPQGKLIDKDIIDNLKSVFPDWEITSPNYRKIYNEKKLAKVKKEMEGLDGYELVPKKQEEQISKVK